MAKRIVTKIGDMFSVTLDNGNLRFFQYANYLSEEYFGAKWLGGPDTHYPAVNISKFNLQRLRVGGRFFY